MIPGELACTPRVLVRGPKKDISTSNYLLSMAKC